jgi:hypothetical protein
VGMARSSTGRWLTVERDLCVCVGCGVDTGGVEVGVVGHVDGSFVCAGDELGGVVHG